jgi:hypothetical protein
MVVDKLAEYLADANTDKPSLRGLNHHLLEELMQFVRQELPGGGVKYAADYGCHDDLVMSLAIAMWVVQESGDASAPVQDDSGDVVRIHRTRMYEIREQNRIAAEEAESQAWDNIILGGGYYG